MSFKIQRHLEKLLVLIQCEFYFSHHIIYIHATTHTITCIFSTIHTLSILTYSFNRPTHAAQTEKQFLSSEHHKQEDHIDSLAQIFWLSEYDLVLAQASRGVIMSVLKSSDRKSGKFTRIENDDKNVLPLVWWLLGNYTRYWSRWTRKGKVIVKPGCGSAVTKWLLKNFSNVYLDNFHQFKCCVEITPAGRLL